MSKHEVILRVSKVRSRKGNNSFLFETNLELTPHCVDFPKTGELPMVGSEEHNSLVGLVKNVLNIIFNIAGNQLKPNKALAYKFIFSDKFIVTGLIPLEGSRTESYAEITLPILEEEVIFIFSCIPYNYSNANRLVI